MIRHFCEKCPKPNPEACVAHDGIAIWKLDKPGGCDNCGAFGFLYGFQPAMDPGDVHTFEHRKDPNQ